MQTDISSYLTQKVSSSPLSVFRFFFGLLMCISILRFWSKGWIEELYLEPVFHFSYFGFQWITPIGNYTYLIFLICFISSLFVCVGFKYRLSIIIFFLSFFYIEMMDKTTYLNHYYFISSLSFLMIFLPANSTFSIDNIINQKQYKLAPKWTIDSIKFFIAIVYIYAAIAKMNSDWLFDAMPLNIWMSSKYHFPIFGETVFQQNWFHYFMSWSGMIYDLSIPFLLLYHRTRLVGFLLVIVFHVLTKILFPIGMFPYIMIFSALIFFSHKTHDLIIQNLLFTINKISSLFHELKIHISVCDNRDYRKGVLCVIFFFFLFQLLFPFRYMMYPGELFWTEQGYRFSWRVMLTEKTALTNFKIVDPNDQSFFYVNNSDFLTSFQEKQMSFQADFILEYAHYLGDYFSVNKNDSVQVFVDSYVSLNGRKSQRFIDSNVNLYSEKRSLKNKKWIINLNDEIKGF
tara:strand:- start:4015 stop:5388 length:1374 start_codon:yes stop_codon:yes gene_type:complete